ncbi:MAG: SGNH/GDSL hydrolase family protein [Rhodothermales bacterium]
MPQQFLALGDSYTVGEGVLLEEGWPAQLVQLLAEADIEAAPFKIIAKTGWTSDELLDALDTEQLKPPYDLVTLLVGVNNQYRQLSIDDYQRSIDALLRSAIDFAGGHRKRVVVLSIPDWGVTPFAGSSENTRSVSEIADDIDAFNRTKCRLTYQAGCHYVDVTSITREHKNDPHAWAADGLHPATLMYTQWARKLLPVVQRIVQ